LARHLPTDDIVSDYLWPLQFGIWLKNDLEDETRGQFEVNPNEKTDEIRKK
jgi:hypothetical protein